MAGWLEESHAMKEWVTPEFLETVEPFTVVGSRDLYDAPPVEYLIDDILPLNSVIGLTGAPGCGKTWLSFEMMRAVLTGSSFLGKFQARKASVLFVGRDASWLDYARQWRRLTYEEYAGIQDDMMPIYEGEGEERTLVRGPLVDTNPFDTQTYFLLDSEFNFDDPAMISRLVKTSHVASGEVQYTEVATDEGTSLEEITRQHFGLIVFDCLSKMTIAAEGNNTERAVLFDKIRFIAAETGATVVVLHHNTSESEHRTGEEWRGAGQGGADLGALDVHFNLKTISDGIVRMKAMKFRGLTPHPFTFSLDVQKEGPASLDYLGEVMTKADYDEELIEEMVQLLRGRNNSVTKLTDFSQNLFMKHTEDFKDVKAFRKHISNMLQTYCLKPEARIAKIATSTQGSANLYTLSHTEKERISAESGTSDQTPAEGA